MNNQYEYNNLVSIITPAYNCAYTIAETIESVLGQSYDCWEMIIVDDCSTDATVAVVQKYQEQDSRIRLIQLEKNQGVANARNIGMQRAQGRYLAFLDSDDIWLKDKLTEQILFMKENDIAFSYTQYRQFRENVENCKKLIDIIEVVNYKELLKRNIIGCLTVVLDREKIPVFHMPKERHEDYIVWLSILKQGYKAYGLKQDLARYRISNASVSGDKQKSALWTWNIYRNIEKLSLIKSLYYFSYYFIYALKKHYL